MSVPMDERSNIVWQLEFDGKTFTYDTLLSMVGEACCRGIVDAVEHPFGVLVNGGEWLMNCTPAEFENACIGWDIIFMDDIPF